MILSKTCRLAMLLALIAVCLSALPVSAQRQVRAELERTDRILERVRDSIGQATGNRPDAVFAQAVRVQKEAWESFRKGNLAVATRLTMKARELARRALETAEIDAKGHERIRDLLDSTRDLVEEARSAVHDHGDQQARRLLDVGLTQLHKASEAYRGRQYRRAMRLAVTARELIQRAFDRARGGSEYGAQAAESALERTKILLDEVRYRLDEKESQRAQRFYEEALALQERAEERRRAGQQESAVRLTRQARASALTALFELSRVQDRDDVEEIVSAVGQLILDQAPEIAASGSESAVELLQEARRNHEAAEGSLAKDDLSSALGSSRMAQDLLRRAMETAGIR